MIFIPFLVIDMVVASVLMSLGMMMLSPVLVALPFKLMLFVLADGWNLLLGSLAASFALEATMDTTTVLTLAQNALFMMLLVSAPIMGTALVVGLVVSLFRPSHRSTGHPVVRPKLVAAIVVFAIAGPWMLTTMVEFIRRTLQSIPTFAA